MSFLLDTNIFNHLIEGKILISDLPTDFPIIVTHLQRDEIMRCPDSVKKSHLYGLLKTLTDIEVPLETAVCGIARAGLARVGSGQILEELIKRKKRKLNANEHDALLGEVAIKNQFVLVTHDRDLGEIVQSLGGHVRSIVSGAKSRST